MERSFIMRGDLVYSAGLTELTAVRDGFLVCRDGVSGGVYASREEIPEEFRELPLLDYSGRLVIPGFTDLHVHAPQYAFRGLGMDMELLDWLNSHAFPEEKKYEDTAYAEKAYRIFAEDMKKGGTTRAVVFGTMHTDATLLLMRLLEEAGICAMVGKVNMDRNSPDYLCEASAEESISETERWLEEAEKAGFRNVQPILTPRFIPSCSDELMEKLGKLALERGLPLQSHLSENISEIAWVKELCPWSSSYGQAYDAFHTLGEQGKTVMAHCVWCPEEETALMKKRGTYVAHCPASNADLSSGIAPIRKYLEEGLHVGLGTDVAGGHSPEIRDAMVEAVQMSKLYARYIDKEKKPLSMAEAFYLATKGGGSFFGKTGSFEKGYEVDALVLSEEKIPSAMEELTPAQRLERFIYLACDRDILHKFVRGKRIF